MNVINPKFRNRLNKRSFYPNRNYKFKLKGNNIIKCNRWSMKNKNLSISTNFCLISLLHKKIIFLIIYSDKFKKNFNNVSKLSLKIIYNLNSLLCKLCGWTKLSATGVFAQRAKRVCQHTSAQSLIYSF